MRISDWSSDVCSSDLPDPVAKSLKVVVRKGRENYLCLLNLEEAGRTLPMQPQHATALGLMARWARANRDGDLQGGDFPAWLGDLIGRGRTSGLDGRARQSVGWGERVSVRVEPGGSGNIKKKTKNENRSR